MGWTTLIPSRFLYLSFYVPFHLFVLQELLVLTGGFILDGSPTSFAQFPRWHAGLNGTLALKFRTREPNGLLLYTDDGGTCDFFEVRLAEGNARLRFNLGGGTAMLAAGKNLHDSQWHQMQITRNAEETILSVDDDVQKRLTEGPDYHFGNATTNSAVFIGGLPAWYGSELSLLALPSAFFEPRFQGSVKDIIFTSDDGVLKPQELQESQGIRTSTPHPQHAPNGDKTADDYCEEDNPCLNGGICISTDTGPICDCRITDYEGDLCEQTPLIVPRPVRALRSHNGSAVPECSPTTCANHGVCVEMWNSYACDCNMTSFTGPICADESVSYKFGPGAGLITLTFPNDKMPDTKADMIALGFNTTADNGTLTRIDSGTSFDYLEIKIVNGKVSVEYNVGSGHHLIREQSVHVNDGQYHVVRVSRSGPNSTIQVDDQNVQVKQPPGRQLTVFNSHSTIQVGGKSTSLRGTIKLPFQGIISGLVINDLRILDMAMEGDPRIAFRGDVELLDKHAGASPTYEGDDLVYSGGGGCWDDEDDCGEVEATTDDDDPITPVYSSPTPRPSPQTTASISGGGIYVHGWSSLLLLFLFLLTMELVIF